MSKPCQHPSASIVYYSEVDEDDAVFEDHWCAECNKWMTPGEMMEIRERPDWEGPTTEQDLEWQKGVSL